MNLLSFLNIQPPSRIILNAPFSTAFIFLVISSFMLQVNKMNLKCNLLLILPNKMCLTRQLNTEGLKYCNGTVELVVEFMIYRPFMNLSHKTLTKVRNKDQLVLPITLEIVFIFSQCSTSSLGNTKTTFLLEIRKTKFDGIGKKSFFFIDA